MTDQPRRRCGTPSGYSAHQYRDEKPCDACTAAKKEYDERLRKAPHKVRAARRAARAQQRALVTLAQLHRDEYRQLYLDAKRAFEREEQEQ